MNMKIMINKEIEKCNETGGGLPEIEIWKVRRHNMNEIWVAINEEEMK